MLCFLMMFIKMTTPWTWDNPILSNLYSEYTYVMKWYSFISEKYFFVYVLFLNFTPNHFVIILIFFVDKSLVVCVMFCGSLFIVFLVHFLLTIVLPVLWFRASDWPSHIWQLFIPLFEILRVEVELCCRSFGLIFLRPMIYQLVLYINSYFCDKLSQLFQFRIKCCCIAAFIWEYSAIQFIFSIKQGIAYLNCFLKFRISSPQTSITVRNQCNKHEWIKQIYP